LANPNADNWASSKKKSMNISRVYTAISVVSEFKQGKFEQTIKGLLYQLPKPDGSNKAPTAPMPTSGSDQRQPSNGQVANVTTTTNAATSVPPSILSLSGNRLNNLAGATAVYQQSPMRALTTPITKEVTPNSTVGESTVMQTTDLQPQSPPAPPTSGSGENISANRTEPPATIAAANQEGLATAPPGPQDMVRDA
jgi:hypothetical protein